MNSLTLSATLYIRLAQAYGCENYGEHSYSQCTRGAQTSIPENEGTRSTDTSSQASGTTGTSTPSTSETTKRSPSAPQDTLAAQTTTRQPSSLPVALADHVAAMHWGLLLAFIIGAAFLVSWGIFLIQRQLRGTASKQRPIDRGGFTPPTAPL